MSSAVKAEIVNLKEFQAQLKRLSGAVAGKKLAQSGEAGLLLIQNAAKEKAPKLTRTLSRSIHTEVLETGAYHDEVGVGTNVVYGPIQEFGGVITPKKAKMLHWIDRDTKEHRFAHSVTIPAHPYLRPAWDENIQRTIEKIKTVLVSLLKAAA